MAGLTSRAFGGPGLALSGSSDALSVEDLDRWEAALLPLSAAVGAMPRLVIDEEQRLRGCTGDSGGPGWRVRSLWSIRPGTWSPCMWPATESPEQRSSSRDRPDGSTLRVGGGDRDGGDDRRLRRRPCRVIAGSSPT